ncbi:MAG: HAD-IA family hydrolase [Pseudomonadota bacterium]
MTTHVMLDVDGVVISGHRADEELWTHHMQSDLGLDPAALVEGFFQRDWIEVVTGEKDLIPVLQTALDRMKAEVTAEALTEYWFAKDARIVEPVIEDCQRLRELGLTVILTTNQEHRRAAYLMQDLGLGKFVDGIVYSAQAGAQKPARAFFDFAMARTGARAKAHLLVDDHLANVDAARTAGWQAHHWTSGHRLWDVVKSERRDH